MFIQVRHKPPTPLDQPRELIVACAPMRSNVNLSRVVRTAGCCGVATVIACGNAKVIDKIARDAAEDEAGEHAVEVRIHRTLVHPLKELKLAGYRLVGLEQTTNAISLHEYAFARKSVLVVGNERHGLTDDLLQLLDDVVEIPVYGKPYAYNAATAASIALYEFCRQYPRG